jgi:hypothetical protein
MKFSILSLLMAVLVIATASFGAILPDAGRELATERELGEYKHNGKLRTERFRRVFLSPAACSSSSAHVLCGISTRLSLHELRSLLLLIHALTFALHLLRVAMLHYGLYALPDDDDHKKFGCNWCKWSDYNRYYKCWGCEWRADSH